MSKQIKAIAELLKGTPSYGAEDAAKELFDKLVNNDFFEKKYEYREKPDGAYTLPVSAIGRDDVAKLNLYAYEHEDYYTWVNFFVCIFDDGEYVIGDFEDVVYASSKEAFDILFETYPPVHWDYGDI